MRNVPWQASALLCEQQNSFLRIYHSQFAYTILYGVLGCHKVGPTAFSFFASQTLLREEERKDQAAFRLSCFLLFVYVWFGCLLARCINVRQNVRLRLQRSNGSRPHICWNYRSQSGRFQLEFCLGPYKASIIFTLPLPPSTSTKTKCLHFTNNFLAQNPAVSIFKQI